MPREEILTPHPQLLVVDEVMARRSLLGISHQCQTAPYSNSRCLQESRVSTSKSPTGGGLDRPNLRWHSAMDRYRRVRPRGDWPASKRVVTAMMSSRVQPACSQRRNERTWRRVQSRPILWLACTGRTRDGLMLVVRQALGDAIATRAAKRVPRPTLVIQMQDGVKSAPHQIDQEVFSRRAILLRPVAASRQAARVPAPSPVILPVPQRPSLL